MIKIDPLKDMANRLRQLERDELQRVLALKAALSDLRDFVVNMRSVVDQLDNNLQNARTAILAIRSDVTAIKTKVGA